MPLTCDGIEPADNIKAAKTADDAARNRRFSGTEERLSIPDRIEVESRLHAAQIVQQMCRERLTNASPTAVMAPLLPPPRLDGQGSPRTVPLAELAPGWLGPPAGTIQELARGDRQYPMLQGASVDRSELMQRFMSRFSGLTQESVESWCWAEPDKMQLPEGASLAWREGKAKLRKGKAARAPKLRLATGQGGGGGGGAGGGTSRPAKSAQTKGHSLPLPTARKPKAVGNSGSGKHIDSSAQAHRGAKPAATALALAAARSAKSGARSPPQPASSAAAAMPEPSLSQRAATARARMPTPYPSPDATPRHKAAKAPGGADTQQNPDDALQPTGGAPTAAALDAALLSAASHSESHIQKARGKKARLSITSPVIAHHLHSETKQLGSPATGKRGKGKGDSSTATKGVNPLYLAMAAPGASNVAFSTVFGEREKSCQTSCSWGNTMHSHGLHSARI